MPTRLITVCPYCSKPVKSAKRTERYGLLVFPLLLALVANAFALPGEAFSSTVLWVLAVVAALGLALMVRHNSLERDEEV